VSASADITQLLSGLGEAKERGINAALHALDQFGEHVLGDAQQLAPVLTGFLKASGTTLPAERNGDQITKVLGFNASYAAAVHEVLDVDHPNGEAKYLETAVRNNEPKMAPFIGAEVQKAL
jgi:hypothetical protein